MKLILYTQSNSFGHYPELVTIGEVWNIDRLVNRKLWLHDRITAATAPIHLSISCSDLASLVNKTLRYLNSSTWGSNALVEVALQNYGVSSWNPFQGPTQDLQEGLNSELVCASNKPHWHAQVSVVTMCICMCVKPK